MLLPPLPQNKHYNSQPQKPKMEPQSSPEIVFFDLETTVPRRAGQRYWVLEFGAMVVCPLKLVELESFSTLIKPEDLSVVPLRSSRCEGITRELIKNSPSFDQVADKIFSIMNGRVWAGHNIQRFDSHRLNDAFMRAGRPAPVCAGMIDSLCILTNRFGRRAGNMKMATLATYFGLGEQKHRSLDDVRMNLEVLKNCATVLFLESSLPNELHRNWQSPPSIVTRSRCSDTFQALSLPINDLHTNWQTQTQMQMHIPSKMVTRSQTSAAMIQNREESIRVSPPSSSMVDPRTVPAIGNLGKVTRGVSSLLSKANGSRTLTTLLRHSHCIL